MKLQYSIHNIFNSYLFIVEYLCHLTFSSVILNSCKITMKRVVVLLSFLLTWLCVASPLKASSNQRLYCYDGPNCQGIRITIETLSVPDLGQSPYYFDNRIQSCLYNGIYILYDGPNFNENNLGVSTKYKSN